MPTFAATKKGYLNLWNAATILPAERSSADKAARYIIAHLDRYEAVAKRIGKPGIGPLIGALHWREDSGNFAGVLHNGEHIIGTGRKTRLEPPGRGPFATWEDAAVDALVLKGWQKITDWNLIERWLYQAEPFNGWGYFLYHNENSPYLWAATSKQQRGKYTSDGHFDPDAWDQQLGVVAILKAIFAIDPSLAPKKTTPVTTIAVSTVGTAVAAAGSALTVDPSYVVGALLAIFTFFVCYLVKEGTSNMPILGANWKTTVGGIGTLLGAIGAIATQVSTGTFTLDTATISTIVMALGTVWTAFSAKDNNVTGGTVKQ